MKALTVKAPHWGLILTGEKTIETRTWHTKHRGWLLIHAGAPVSAVVGRMYIEECREMQRSDWGEACCDPWFKNGFAWIISKVERFKKPFPIRGMPGLFEVHYERN